MTPTLPSEDDEGVILDWSEIADHVWPSAPVADIPTRPRVWVYGARERPTVDG